MSGANKTLFRISTPLGFVVRSTADYWRVISTLKYPVMADELEAVKTTLQEPELIRQSKGDPQVLLFYRKTGRNRYLCAAVKRLNGDGFLITAYPTENIKEGAQIWTK